MRLNTYGAAVVVFALLLAAAGTASAGTVAGGTASVPDGEGTAVTVADATVDGTSNSTLTVAYRLAPDANLTHTELRVYGPNHYRYYELDGRSGTVDVTLQAGALAGGVHRFRAAVVNASPASDPALATDVATVEARSPVVLVSTALDPDSVGKRGNATLTATLRNPSPEPAAYDVAVYESTAAGPVVHWNDHGSVFGGQALRRVVVPAGANRTYALGGGVEALRNGSALRVDDGDPWTVVGGAAVQPPNWSDDTDTETRPNRTDGTDGTDDASGATGGGPPPAGGVGADPLDRSAEYETVATTDGATVLVRAAPGQARFGTNLPGVSGAGVTVERVGFAFDFDAADFRVEFGTPTTNTAGPPLDGSDALAYVPARAVDARFDRATVRVRVDAALPAGATPDDVALYRHRGDDGWTRLDTERTGERTYEANVTAFSTLAVGVDADTNASGPADATGRTNASGLSNETGFDAGATGTGTGAPGNATGDAPGDDTASAAPNATDPTDANGSSSAADATPRAGAPPGSDGETATTAPGFSAVAALVALVGAALLARRER